MISTAVSPEIWNDGSSGAKSTEKKTYIHRENNKDILIAQSDIKNIYINFVRLMPCGILQRCSEL